MKPAASKKKERLNDSVLKVIVGLNALLLEAKENELRIVERILHDAKESIAWWAAYDDYNESKVDKLIHRLTTETGIQIALELLAKLATLKDDAIKEEILAMVKL